jgi:Protein of unknown function (DUF3137)
MTDDVDDRIEEDADEQGEDAGSSPVETYFDAIGDKAGELVETTLKPRLDGLEADRLKLKSAITRGGAIVVFPIFLFVGGDLFTGILNAIAGSSPIVQFIIEWWTPLVLVIAALAVIYVVAKKAIPGVAAHLAYRNRFKQEVVTEIFKAIAPHGTYQPDHHVTQQVFDQSGIFSGNYQTFKGDDLVRGRIGDLEYEASEIRAQGRLTVQTKRKNETMTSHPNVTVFQGMFFHLGSRRTMRGHTIVEPEDAGGRLPRHRVSSGFEQVSMDDEPFDETYRVYSTDAAEAKQILSPHVRARLLDIASYATRTPFFAFVKDRVFVAIHAGTVLEPNIQQKNSYGLVSTVADYFAWPALFVRELALDSSSWPTGASHSVSTHTFATTTFGSSAGSAGSILSQPAAAGLAGLDPSKPITLEHLTTAAMPDANEQDVMLRPPPESRVRLSPVTSEGLDVSFGITLGTWMRILWTLALTPFVVAGAARIVGAQGEATLRAITAQLPIAAEVAEYASQYQIPFGVVVLLFYLLPTWALMHSPRGVRINREGVRVSKRLWPIATQYRLDQIGGVQVNDRQVILQRKGVSFLRRFLVPAPAMRTNEEARWLGAHMRRALTMFGGLRP